MPKSNILKAIETLTKKAGDSTEYKSIVTIMNLTSMADSLEHIDDHLKRIAMCLEEK